MSRKPNQFIELDGPLFDPNVVRNFKQAVAEGIEELADEGDDVMMAQISAGGFVRTGQFLRSVDVVFVRSSLDVIGYAKILPTAVWPDADRPTRTWIARGLRGGVKMRKGFDIFARTTTVLRQMQPEERIARRVQVVLE
ncbi:MAG: hypothetical protein HY873_12065 [Chloroflexi bacterium]|nr:hypothetical protein [Chloroflexota bacterium]